MTLYDITATWLEPDAGRHREKWCVCADACTVLFHNMCEVADVRFKCCCTQLALRMYVSVYFAFSPFLLETWL